MQCLGCGAILPDAARFCVGCGAAAPPVCSACGQALSAGANFCPRCGAKATARQPSEDAAEVASSPALARYPADSGVERRQLTVLFCDLVGSTALSTRLDPEDLREIIGAYHRCVAETVEAFDGFVARYMGDGAMVYFGYPNAHEDNAERAVRAALALSRNVANLRTRNEPLSTRIGIATGLVIVGELVSAGATREQTALGQTPNLAARLEAAAMPDTVVIADNTRRLAGERFGYQGLGLLTLKGFDDPVRAWRVVGEERIRHRLAAIDAPQTPAAPSETNVRPGPPLVGREQELGLLGDRWQQVTEGQGRVVLLLGDAGIGKSRLVQAFTSSVGDTPHYELQFRSSAYHAHSPLYPVIHLVPGVLGWRRVDSDATRLEKLQAFCARLHLSTSDDLPLLVSLLSLPDLADFPLAPMSAERRKQLTLQTLLKTALALAAERPLLMVVEDLHLIDPTTMELLTMLADQAPTVRLFALFTARLDFEAPWPPHSHVTSLMLTRLSRRQTETMIVHAAGGNLLPTDVVLQIVAKTDGVPLFVEELTKMLLESGRLRLEGDRYRLTGSLQPLAIPATLQDSLTARLDRLASAKSTAQFGAMLGREFPLAVLRAVSTVDEGALQRDLARLVDAEFLYQRGTQSETVYIFKHALIQDAAYQSLLRTTRAQLHKRIAHVLIEQFGSEVDAHPELVAMHYTEGGDFEKAPHWWQRAGQRSFQRASYNEAIAHYLKGLAALERLPVSEGRDQLELALQVELGYALIPVKGWSAPESAQAFTRAGELGQRIRDTPKLFRALWGLGAFHFVQGDQHGARRVADQCLGIACQHDDVDSLIEAHYLCGIVSCVMGDFVRGQADLDECIRRYGPDERTIHRTLYGQDAKASALGWLSMALWCLGEPDAALERARESLALVRDTPQPFLLARGLAGVGFVHVFRGEAQSAGAPLEQALALCAEQGFWYFHAIVAAFAGANSVVGGKPVEGIAQMEASIAALRTIGSELLLTVVLGYLAAAHCALLQAKQGLAVIDDGLERAATNGERWGEAELHRIRGDLLLTRGTHEAQRAEASYRTALDLATAQCARAYRLRAATSLARLWRAQGRHAEATSLLAEIVGTWPDDLQSPDLGRAREVLREL